MKILSLIFTSILLATPATSKPMPIDISLKPSTTEISPSGFFVDIYLSGLQSGLEPELLGGWSMDIQYDPSLLVATFDEPGGFVDRLGSRIDGEAIPAPYPYGSAPGVLTLGELSLLPVNNYIDPADNLWKRGLDCVQREPMCDPDPLMNNPGGPLLDGFMLARIAFSIVPGADYNVSTTITAKNLVFSNGAGDSLPVPITDPSVTLPEPLTSLILSVGLIAFGFYRKGALTGIRRKQLDNRAAR